MNKDQIHTPDIDDFLRQALRDDLPPDLERRMKTHFLELRSALVASEGQRGEDRRFAAERLFEGCGWRWANLILRRETLAFLSVLLMVLGGAMHLSGYHSSFADSVSTLKISLSVAEAVQQAVSMKCIVSVQQVSGKPLVCVVHWVSPGRTRVDFSEANILRKTMWLKEGTATIVDHVSKTLLIGEDAVKTMSSQFQPANGFMSPRDVTRCFNGSWEPMGRTSHTGREERSFWLLCPDDGAPVELSIDMSTLLPQSLAGHLSGSGGAAGEADLIRRIHFVWNQPVAPDLMVPRIIPRDPVLWCSGFEGKAGAKRCHPRRRRGDSSF